MYCPNRECPDFKETGVPGEFVEGVTVCPFCGSSLVEEIPAQVQDETETDTTNDSTEELVVIATYGFRHDADLALTYLMNSGIDVVESPDDCGGTHPAVGFATGIRLLAPVSQAKRAIALIDKAEEDR